MMNRIPRVLVVDDLQTWQEHLVEILRHDGFFSAAASSADQAIKHLEEELFHILILDIRMKDADPTNSDGITMLSRLKERNWNEVMKVIMLSAVGTPEQMRLAFKDHDVADFVDKDQFITASFLENVRQVLAEIRINLTLEIQWEQASMKEQVVRHLEGNGTAMKHTAAFRRLINTELDDLLCRLFHTAHGVMVKPFTPGHSGASVLRALPYYEPGGSGRQLIVKFGHWQTIKQEHENFKKFVANYVGGGRSTTVWDMRTTPRLGAIAYSLLGTTSEHIESMRQFYQHATADQVKEVLKRLFLQTCSSWYANATSLRPYNLTKSYQGALGYTAHELEHALEQLKSVRVKERLFFMHLGIGRGFTNPLHFARHTTFIRSTYECFTHGDFNPDNILVDDAGYTWLIDFQSTGPGHILRDIATFDSVLRFQLLTSDEATLEERLRMEEALYGIDSFSQIDELKTRFQTENSNLRKTYELLIYLRTLAWRQIERSANDRIEEYYIALFYVALSTLRYSSLNEVQREHALLSASLLTDYLEQSEAN